MAMESLNCEEFVDLVVEYVDGGLEPEISTRFENHLDDCPECVDFLESYRRTGEVCRRALNVEMPQPVKSSLFNYLRTELKPPEA